MTTKAITLTMATTTHVLMMVTTTVGVLPALRCYCNAGATLLRLYGTPSAHVLRLQSWCCNRVCDANDDVGDLDNGSC